MSILGPLSAALLAILIAHSASAGTCANGLNGATGNAGDEFYNSSINMKQYCNGTTWVNVWSSSAAPIGTLTAGDYCTANGPVATGAPFYLSGSQTFVSRASTATYYNSSGVISTAAINTARTNYTYNGTSWVNSGTLIEPQATNLNYPSVGFCSGGSGFAAAPDGTTTAERIVWSGGGYCYSATYPITSGATYTASIYIKANNSSSVISVVEGDECGQGYVSWTYNFGTSSGSTGGVSGYGLTWSNVSGGAINVGGGWYRVYVVGTVTGAATFCGYSSGVVIPSSPPYVGGDVDVWGLQEEAGALPTSFIPTTTGAVTRAADVFSGGNFNCTTAAPIPASLGGTGDTSLTTHGVLIGEGASAVAPVAVGTANYLLQADGTSSDPTWTNTITGLTLSGDTLTGTIALPGSGTITSGGNIGVGTTTPQSALHVYGGEAQVGSSGASCTSGNAGALRYAGTQLSFCNGTTWVAMQ
jgi:hypothetical protein